MTPEHRQKASGPHWTRTPLGPRQEELLSYLQGLAPVGKQFEFRPAEVSADLGFNVEVTLYQTLRKLVRKGLVERVDTGKAGRKGKLKVLRRLEEARSGGPAAATGTAAAGSSARSGGRIMGERQPDGFGQRQRLIANRVGTARGSSPPQNAHPRRPGPIQTDPLA